MEDMTIDLTPQEQDFLQSARQMGREACEVLKHHFRRRDLDIEDKGNAFDIVTEADKGSERIILDYLHSRYPDHAILSEESGDDHRQAQYQWVIDPLDGTVNYSAGIATYCISIGLKAEGETLMGYVYAPSLDEEFWAIRGKGAYGPYGRLEAKGPELCRCRLARRLLGTEPQGMGCLCRRTHRPGGRRRRQALPQRPRHLHLRGLPRHRPRPA